MSGWNQRFLAELEREWEHLSAEERQRLRREVCTRLETLTSAERALGAGEDEAQRRAVSQIGEEGVLRRRPSLRLAPVWQVALVWLAGVALLESVLRLGITPLNAFVPLIYVRTLVVYPLVGGLTTAFAYCWHPRAAGRGVLFGLTIWSLQTGFQLLHGWIVYQNLPVATRQELLLGPMLHLVAVVLAALGTLYALQRARMKKLPKAL